MNTSDTIKKEKEYFVKYSYIYSGATYGNKDSIIIVANSAKEVVEKVENIFTKVKRFTLLDIKKI